MEEAKKMVWISAAKLQHHIGTRNWGAGWVQEGQPDFVIGNSAHSSRLELGGLQGPFKAKPFPDSMMRMKPSEPPGWGLILHPTVEFPSNHLLPPPPPGYVTSVLRIWQSHCMAFFRARSASKAEPHSRLSRKRVGDECLPSLCLGNAASLDLRGTGRAPLKASSWGWSLYITSLLHHPSSI